MNLSWVDEYFKNVKPYVFVRVEDNILIKRPNKVHKLNPSGALILKALLDGEKIDNMINKINDKGKELQLYHFLNAIRQAIDGNMDVFTTNPAVGRKTFELNFSKYPVLSELAVTYRCNLRCSFCYAGCNKTINPAKSSEELNTNALKKIIDKIFNQAKVPSISFTGGEPLLRADLPKLIYHAKKTGMRVNLISNGTLITSEKAKELVSAGLDSAQISIESTNEEIHDKLTAVKGSFIKSLNAVRFFKNLGIHVHSNTTLNRLNIDDAANFPAFVKNILGLDKFSMNMMIPTGSVTFNNSLKLYYEEMGGHIDKIISECSVHDVELMWYSPLPLCMYNTITHGLGNKGCSCCDGLLSVAPNGDVLPCASFDDTVGNIFNKSFEEIWYEKEAVYYRCKSFAHSNCKQCEHFALCNGACPLYWRDMGFGELNKIINTN